MFSPDIHLGDVLTALVVAGTALKAFSESQKRVERRHAENAAKFDTTERMLMHLDDCVDGVKAQLAVHERMLAKLEERTKDI